MLDQTGMRNLHGDVPIQVPIVSQIDGAKAALAQHLLNAISTDLAGAGYVSPLSPAAVFGWASFCVTSSGFDGFTLAVGSLESSVSCVAWE